MLDARKITLAVLSAIILYGTVSSVVHSTYLDTSNPFLTHLPHPHNHNSYFASKSNVLNVYYIKLLWGWTTVSFLGLFFTSSQHTRTKERVFKYLIATAVWMVFTSWFFGPPVLDRLTFSTGGECILTLPSGALVTVPEDFCYRKTTISLATHPSLFAASLLLPDNEWHAKPRLRRGHDVSGHIFLLIMSTMFLVDQLRSSFVSVPRGVQTAWPPSHKWAVIFAILNVFLMTFASYTTSVYFHTPFEKFTGFLLGVAGFAVTQLSFLQERKVTGTVPGGSPAS